MSTPCGRLKPRMFDRLGDGKHADGGGLYLWVRGNSRHWQARFTQDGRGYDFRVGDAADMPLEDARHAVSLARSKVRQGLEPTTTLPTGTPTFEEVTRSFYTDRWLPDAVERRGNIGKYQDQWIEDFERHIFPRIGKHRLTDVRPVVLVETFRSIWRTKHETAKKLLQRTGIVVDYAISLELMETNPVHSARTALGKVQASGEHMSSVPWRWAPDFFAAVKDCGRRQTPATYAMRLLMLTAMRPSEVQLLRWREIEPKDVAVVGLPLGSFDGLAHGSAGLIVLPPERHKMGSTTRKPAIIVLSRDAQALLAEVKERAPGGPDDLVFPQTWRDRHLSMSGNAINNVLKKAKDPRFREFTAHGMRSTVADALAEVEGITSEERRRILHQATGNKVDAAYFRSPIIARQFQLLNIWSDLLHGRRGAEVIDLRARQAQTVGNS